MMPLTCSTTSIFFDKEALSSFAIRAYASANSKLCLVCVNSITFMLELYLVEYFFHMRGFHIEIVYFSQIVFDCIFCWCKNAPIQRYSQPPMKHPI